MKQLTIIFSALLLFSACDSVNIFGPEDTSEYQTLPQNKVEFLTVFITGGFAGVSQELHVFSDGRISLITNQGYSEKNIQLTDEQVLDIAKVFEKNNFFALSSSYKNVDVRDAFLYQITFSSGERDATLTTNGFDIPENLENILEEIHALIEKIYRYGLGLSLSVDKTTVQKDETIQLTFTVKNITQNPVELLFNTSQIFDFHASSSPNWNPGNIVWNWSHSKDFAQVINHSTLEAQKSRTFKTTWDCRDNHGVRLAGTYFLTGALVSIPGGKSEAVRLTIE